MKEVHVIQAHPANCICIEFHPSGEYFAVGAADAVVSLWNLQELACLRTFTNLDWPVRAISFNHDGSLLASASEDLLIDISHVDSGEKVEYDGYIGVVAIETGRWDWNFISIDLCIYFLDLRRSSGYSHLHCGVAP
jgi:WD40 repeat protein